jgi:hypothetical protein
MSKTNLTERTILVEKPLRGITVFDDGEGNLIYRIMKENNSEFIDQIQEVDETAFYPKKKCPYIESLVSKNELEAIIKIDSILKLKTKDMITEKKPAQIVGKPKEDSSVDVVFSGKGFHIVEYSEKSYVVYCVSPQPKCLSDVHAYSYAANNLKYPNTIDKRLFPIMFTFSKFKKESIDYLTELSGGACTFDCKDFSKKDSSKSNVCSSSDRLIPEKTGTMSKLKIPKIDSLVPTVETIPTIFRKLLFNMSKENDVVFEEYVDVDGTNKVIFSGNIDKVNEKIDDYKSENDNNEFKEFLSFKYLDSVVTIIEND